MTVMDCALRFLPTTVYVHLIVMQSANGQSSKGGCRKEMPKRRHNADRCLFRVREQIINGLVWNKSISSIARVLFM